VPNRTLACAIVVVAAILGCATGTASNRSATPPTQHDLAVELVRSEMPQEQWGVLMRTFSQALLQLFEKEAAAEGKPLPPNFRRVLAETTGETISYEEMAAFLAAVYSRYYTADEMRAILAYQHTPVFQKQMQLAPRLMEESLKYTQRIFEEHKSEIRAKIAARLKTETPSN